MSLRSDDLFLVDLIEAAESIAGFLGNLQESEFASDDRVRSAVLWKLLIIGEATSKISDQTRQCFANIPWDDIRGLRNRLAHGYFSLSWSRIWQIASKDVAQLRTTAETVLAAEFPEVWRRLQEHRGNIARDNP